MAGEFIAKPFAGDERAIALFDEIENGPKITCGSRAARAEFDFASGYRNLNHGSFGTYPASLRMLLRHYQERAESRPDVFIRYEYPQILDQARNTAARLLNAPIEGCVFVQNATTAFNTVFRNLNYESGDVIVYPPTVYGACEKTIIYITETTLAECHRLQYTLPLTDDELCNLYESAFESIRAQGKVPKIAVFDTIASAPGVCMPFQRLTALCRAYGVLSCIDGAHSMGQIPLDITALDPDFFLSNAHKWLHVPRGCCVLFVPERHHAIMRSTLPTSHGFDPLPREGVAAITNPLPPSTKSQFITNFEFIGSLDNSPYLCLPAALAWRRRLEWQGDVGERAIMRYQVQLARKAASLTSQILGTDVLENAEGTLGNCAMSNVELPLSFEHDAESDTTAAIKIGQWITKVLIEEYDTFIAIMWHADKWWVRWSAQVYLDEEDFVWGAEALRDVCARAREGQWR